MCRECPRPLYAKGLCRVHYDKARGYRAVASAGACKGRWGSWREPPDPIVVERVAYGNERLPTNPAERRAVVALLTRHGVSAREIALRLGVAQRTVQRLRSRGLVCRD